MKMCQSFHLEFLSCLIKYHVRTIDWVKCLRFITNPRLCVENDQRKSTASVLLQHLVKGAVIKSASPLTRFEIIPFHCPVSTVNRLGSKTLSIFCFGTFESFQASLGRNQEYGACWSTQTAHKLVWNSSVKQIRGDKILMS